MKAEKYVQKKCPAVQWQCMVFALAHISLTISTAAVWLQGNETSNDIYVQRENDKAHCYACA